MSRDAVVQRKQRMWDWLDSGEKRAYLDVESRPPDRLDIGLHCGVWGASGSSISRPTAAADSRMMVEGAAAMVRSSSRVALSRPGREQAAAMLKFPSAQDKAVTSRVHHNRTSHWPHQAHDGMTMRGARERLRCAHGRGDVSSSGGPRVAPGSGSGSVAGLRRRRRAALRCMCGGGPAFLTPPPPAATRRKSNVAQHTEAMHTRVELP